MRTSLAVTLLGSAAATADFPGTCGLGNTKDPDCAYGDMGSCGNACCSVKVRFASSAEAVTRDLMQFFVEGGADGAFKAATTWGDFFNITDGCRKLNPEETTNTYLCQATHTTTGSYHFNDTVNVLVGPTSTAESGAVSTVVTLFSVSQVAGALGDAGQNFKNLAMVYEALTTEGEEMSPLVSVFGCPGATFRSRGAAPNALLQQPKARTQATSSQPIADPWNRQSMIEAARLYI